MIDDEYHWRTAKAAYVHARNCGAKVFRSNDVLDIAVDPDGDPYVLIRENEGLRWDRALPVVRFIR